jgi:hypothetical protein
MLVWACITSTQLRVLGIDLAHSHKYWWAVSELRSNVISVRA